MRTGLVYPREDNRRRFENLDSFYEFYYDNIARSTNSLYEKRICEKYIEYLQESSCPLEEPFLIPEFRYLGLCRDHMYRLDFTVLNQHTRKYVGFEISPASSHMSIARAKERTQKDMNEELREKWEKEMSKRNSYYKNFDISVVSFTDSRLQDINTCFEEIRRTLMARPEERGPVSTQKQRLQQLNNEIF